ncbi:MAG: mannose-1-phosphate guanylyltransferase, partial [Propionibacteriales bacterium]|nr:mannose-1-phosphate guanylyltransferase [Propionibacteriales bacterium]
DQAFTLAEAETDVLVTLGVVPTSPHTGYGYLQRGAEIGAGTDAYEVLDFAEKPDLATAKAYLASGDHWWNAGMFVWRTSVLLDQLRQLVPDSYVIVTELAEDPSKLGELYPRLPKNSVDYAIMEPVSRGAGSARVVVVGLPIDWQDVGGYQQLAENLPADARGNVTDGTVVQLDGTDNVVINRGPDGHLVATLGLSEMIIVTSGNVTLVCPRSESQRIKELVGEVVEHAGADYN